MSRLVSLESPKCPRYILIGVHSGVCNGWEISRFRNVFMFALLVSMLYVKTIHFFFIQMVLNQAQTVKCCLGGKKVYL